MKINYSFLAVLLGVVVTILPSHAQILGDTISVPGLFSYQTPKGWTVKETQISKYKVAMDAPQNNFAANINVVSEKFSGSLADYVKANKTALQATPVFQNVKIVDEKPFVTGAGANGVRVVVQDTMGKVDLQQVFYFFDGPNTKLVVTASSLAGDGDHYAPIFDASLKTFTPQ